MSPSPGGDPLTAPGALSPEARALLERRARASGQGADAPIPRRRAGPAPLSFAQQRIWLFEQTEPGTAVYHSPKLLRLRGPLDVPALERALTRMVERHEVLRTRYRPGPDAWPVQEVRAPEVLPLERLPVERASDALPDALGRLDACARRPFDLESGPLPRATLVRLARNDHLLQVTFHHIAFDGWSTAVFVRELGALYSAEVTGRPAPLPPLPLQYGDYAVWQRERVTGVEAEEALGYWRERLAGAPADLGFPLDLACPRERHYVGAVERTLLPEPLVGALRALARSEGATLFAAVLAGYQALLARHAGVADVVVGTPIAGRDRRELHGLIGVFVNTLALRTDLSGDPGFRELLRRVRETTTGAFARAQLPFERVVKVLNPPRVPGRHPLFQAMLNFRNLPPVEPCFSGLDVEFESRFEGTAPFDLDLEITEGDEGLRCDLVYATELLRADTARRLLGRLRALLEGAVAEPDTPGSRLPMLPPGERDRLLVEWNATDTPAPATRTLPGLVAEQAARSPAAPAVVGAENVLSYGELERWALGLARRLREAGVRPGERVGVAVGRTPALVPALLGIMKSGAAYVPLDLEGPAARVRFVLADAGIRVVVCDAPPRTGVLERAAGPPTTPSPPTEASSAGTDPFTGLLVVPVVPWDPEPSPPMPVPAPPGVPEPASSPESIAYVIYTSGSTGAPKGVEVPHRALVNLARAIADLQGLAPGDRVLQLAAPTFDLSVEELFPALAAGATVVLRSEAMLGSMGALARELGRLEITVAQLPTALWCELGSALDEGAAALPPRLRLLVTGTERTPPESAARWLRLAGSRLRLLHCYGPTEATVTATAADLGAVALYPGMPVPIGRPIANVRAYVLEPSDAPAPIGVPGELFIGGAGVAAGYLGRPELTARHFVSDPFHPAGGRMYRTGDRARWRADGQLEFLGRLDGQLEVRGFRVEPGEVEAALQGCPGVAEVVVAGREDDRGGLRLVAWYVANPGSEVTAAALRQQVGERLPSYMVPSAFVPLDALPRNAHGKMDRALLPDPPEPGRAPRPTRAPTATERTLAALWGEVLRTDRIGPADDFFDLGGNSLLAMRVAAGVARTLGIDLPLPVLFQHSTLAELAGAVDRLRGERSKPAGGAGDGPAADEAGAAAAAEEETGGPGDFALARERTVHDLFAEQVQSRPKAPALRSGDETLTYGELNLQAELLAARLRRRGVGREVLVAVLLERSPSLVVALLAVLKANGAYLPLDPADPEERLAFQLRDSGAALVLTTAALAARLPAGTHTLRLDGPAESADEEDAPVAEKAADRAGPRDLAYVIYTSGSTGTPKGVMVEHRNILHVVRSGCVRMGPEEVFLQLAPVAFDASVFEIWGALTNGALLVLAPPGMAGLDRLGETIRRNGVTTVWLTAPLFARIVETDATVLAGVRQLLTGGDVVSAAACRAALAALPGCELFDGYGPTETTVFATMHRVRAADLRGTIPIGRPLPGTRVHVLDEARAPVARGAPGELYIGGDGVARGYLRRPELTAERFLPDPGATRVARIYRTGDRVRWREDGALEFLGRLDDQVKIRGFRVEPGEIEAALADCAGVAACAVIARRDQRDEPRVVAYYVPVPGTSSGPARLRAELARRLPPYMLPAAFVPMPALPLTRNGKLDRQALPDPEEAGAGSAGKRLAEPESAAELGAAAATAPPPLGTRATPLSAGQRRLYLLEQLQPGTPAYNVAWSVRLEGALNEEALRRGLEIIVHRHAPLRSAFTCSGGEPEQRFAPPAPLPMPVHDLSALAAADQESEVAWLAQAEATRPFDLGRPPLLRVRLLRRAADRHVLLLAAHHIALDGWSLEILRRELAGAYAACARGREPQLPPLPAEFADAVRWEEEQAAAGKLEEGLAFWREHLGDVPTLLELPGGEPHDPPARPGASVAVRLPASTLAGVRTLARRAGASPHAVLLAAYEVLLARAAAVDRFIVGCTASGRTRPELEPLIGFFVATLPLRADLRGDPSALELVGRVRDEVLAALRHQDVPLEAIATALRVPRVRRHTPLVQAMFSLEPVSAAGAELPGVAADWQAVDTDTTKFDLALLLAHGEAGLEGRLEYDTRLFTRDAAFRLADRYPRIVEALVAEPESRLSQTWPAGSGLAGDGADCAAGGESPGTAPSSPPPSGGRSCPGDDLERRITEIWEEMLQVQGVRPEDSFFALGGDSLLAFSLTARLGRELGRPILLGDFMYQPTVAALARRLREGQIPVKPEGRLWVLREGDPALPSLVFLHGRFGGGLGAAAAARLAQRLDPRLTVYVVEPHRRGGPTTIEAMAAEIVADLRRTRPGPYLIVGFCASGAVALEMATQLRAAGESVPLLVELDLNGFIALLVPAWTLARRWADRLSIPAGMRSGRAVRLVQRAARWVADARMHTYRGPEHRTADLGRLMRALAADLLRRLRAHLAPPPAYAYPPEMPEELREDDRDMWFLHGARVTHVPRPYPGRLAVIMATDGWVDRRVPRPEHGWEYVNPRVEIVSVPGKHTTMFDQHVEHLGRELDRLIAQALAEAQA